eukprot:m.593844 g.593844  ORF g.593844 m.593844 type:complete len:50 (-) comp22396_c1_seq1:832-981(-)
MATQAKGETQMIYDAPFQRHIGQPHLAVKAMWDITEENACCTAYSISNA